MLVDTRQRLLDIAEQLFAERGFYGVSIAAIASEVGFTKQALLHYFNSKERLYGAILQRISDDFEDKQTEAEQACEEPTERLIKFYAAIAEPTQINTRRTRLLMRELLDNNARASKTENWYLRDFLERLIGMVRAIESLQTLSREEALAFAYQLLGAVNYFLISTHTLKGILGADVFDAVSKQFFLQLTILIDSRISSNTLALEARAKGLQTNTSGFHQHSTEKK